FFPPATPGQLLSAVTSSAALFADQIYLGIPALILSPLSLFANQGRLRVAFLLCLALFSGAVALTVHSPVFQLYLMLPAAMWFRMPQRILYLYTFAGAVLSGIGFDVIARVRANQRDARRVGAVAVATVIGVAWSLNLDIPQHSLVYFCLGLLLLWGVVLVRSLTVRRSLVLLLL